MAKLILKRKNYSRGYFYEIRRLQSILTVFSMLEPVLWVIFGLDTIFNVILRLEAFRMCFQHLKLTDFLKFDKMA